MSITREDVIQYLEGLSSEELGALADEVVARFGLPPRLMRGSITMGGSAIMGTEPEPACFDVVLSGYGADKLAVIVVVRKLFELGLADAKRLVESAPVVVKQGISPDEARFIADDLRRAGAQVDVR